MTTNEQQHAKSMNEELTKIMAGIERHMHTVQGGFATSGQTLASAVWELGTMCSLSGKALKDMSVEMERVQATTRAQGQEQEKEQEQEREKEPGGMTQGCLL